MKILVLSDSHAGLSFMRYAIRAVRPESVIHLGDFSQDAMTLQEDLPHIRFHIVDGNCDRIVTMRTNPEFLCYDVGGVRLYMTHGHNEKVKITLYRLLEKARQMGAAAALYGHTHTAFCQQQEDGLWVMNPGACGSYGGSVGVIETENGSIVSCKILTYEDLEALL